MRVLIATALHVSLITACAQDVRVHLDVEEVPEHAAWGRTAQSLMVEWHPRIAHVLAIPGVDPSSDVTLRLERATEGIGATTGAKVTVFSCWIDKHPEDFGLVIHELAHVIQGYPKIEPTWVTEGIADYVRWAVYEEKPPSWFLVPKADRGYTKGYGVTAGFFLWLETHQAPGIVSKLNQAMRATQYEPSLFETLTGEDLDVLWARYVAEHDQLEGNSERSMVRPSTSP